MGGLPVYSLPRCEHRTDCFKSIILSPWDYIRGIEKLVSAKKNRVIEWHVDERCRYQRLIYHSRILYGYDIDSFIGTQPFDAMPPATAKRIRDSFWSRAKRHQILWNLINRKIDANGEIVRLATFGSPIFSKSGIWIGYQGIDLIL